MTKVLYFYALPSTFINKDLGFLSEKFSVLPFSFSPPKKQLSLIWVMKELAFILRNFSSAKIYICQFGGYHSFLPALIGKVFNKPCLIITGGTDCVALPSINYGNFRKYFLGLFTKWSYSLCSHISPVHESLMLNNYTYQKDDYPKQGILYFCPQLKTPYTTIYNGYDSSFWKKNKEKKKNVFTTVVGRIKMSFTIPLKGIDLILEIAPLFPECEFRLIGIPPDYNLGETTGNIVKIPFSTNDEIRDTYSESEFYLQLSMSEGFPNALSEAMLCECIPIVSNVGAMPFIINDGGFILNHRDKNELTALIRKALICDKATLAQGARLRIAKNFPDTLRKKNLTALIDRLISETH